MIIPNGFKYNRFNFPVGEMHINITYSERKEVSIFFKFEKNEDLIELLLVVDALKRYNLNLDFIEMNYVPFSRQDRVANYGDCFSLKVFADLINSCQARTVFVTDPHSDVTTALINNCEVVTQDNVFLPYFEDKSDFWLISPDGGALKKIYKLAEKVNCAGVIECSKLRNVKTGEITGVTVHKEHPLGYDCYIVDDICDGGRTFTEIAKELRKLNTGKIILMVTHGHFTKGLEVFDGLIDEIYTLSGKVK